MSMGVKEIFFSYQGEGIFMGTPMIFVRFLGCNLNCYYCDEKSSINIKKSSKINIDRLIKKIIEIVKKKKVKYVSLTGGEPLLQKNLQDFLTKLCRFKKIYNFKVYLETNGSISDNLKKIIDFIDIASIDLKIPQDDIKFVNKSKEFLKCIYILKKHKKDFFIKVIIGNRKKYNTEVYKFISSNIKSIKIKEIILQPVTGEYSKILFFNTVLIFNALKNIVKHIYIIPQLHKLLWRIK
ncbi:MAG: 7-carboxy-7-deazaguanine synthase QueE [Endomicrobia bacterium]|nr:7-carboxy-7-deazaguanine synthase QueE [Endomicrobiia bacterium]